MALQTSPGFAALCQLTKWAKTPLQHVVCRVNTLRISPEEALKEIRLCLAEEASKRGRSTPTAQLHPLVPEALIVSATPGIKPVLKPPDRPGNPIVVVDMVCGNAVLRGAPVYNGGVLAISENASVGDTVSVYAFRGGHRQWVGNGKLLSFPLKQKEVAPKGESLEIKTENDCIVEVTEGQSSLAPIPYKMISRGQLIHQSLPAILVSRVVDPQPGERILNLGCGSGIMTTHLAALTCNEADVVGIDRSGQRIKILINRCRLLGAKVTPIVADGKDFAKTETCQFDRVLVEPNYSTFGIRPLLPNLAHSGRAPSTTIRPLVEAAIRLLKPGGHLVFYTGSVFPSENDATVRWLLDNFDVKLKDAKPRLAPIGVQSPIPVASWMKLSPEEEKAIQRFGFHSAELESNPINKDVPSCFIACFTKNS